MTARGIDDTLSAILDCACDGLAERGAPVCSCSTTVGAPVVLECCECETGVSGSLWGTFVRLTRGDRTTYNNTTGATRPCAPATWVATYRILLYRCAPTIDERGDLPDPETLAEAATALHDDIAAVTRSIHCCPLDDQARVDSVDVISDPLGTCSEVVFTVTVPVSLSAARNAASNGPTVGG